MNQATTDVIAFLTDPELDFGASPMDAELLEDPQMLREAVTNLLEDPAAFMANPEEARTLRAQLDLADWSLVAREFRGRLKTAAGFFEKDVPAGQTPAP